MRRKEIFFGHENSNTKMQFKKKLPDSLKVICFIPFNYELSLLAVGYLSIIQSINENQKCEGTAERAWISDRLYQSLIKNKDRDTNYFDKSDICTESGSDISAADVLCFSLTNPASFPIYFNVLDVYNIPFFSKNRNLRKNPFIIGGGMAFMNPEPYAEMLDAVVVGEGEESIVEIINLLYEHKKMELPENNRIKRQIAGIQSVYVPSLYSFEFNPDNTINKIMPLHQDIPVRVNIGTLNSKNIDMYHFCSYISEGQTAAIVTNRGCKHNCGFCQMANIPYQDYDCEKLKRYVRSALDKGIRRIIINSPSFTQYKNKNEIFDFLIDMKSHYDFDVIIGSVRLDEIDDEYIQYLMELKRFSHTYFTYTKSDEGFFLAVAPETASEELRFLLNKKLSDRSIHKFKDLMHKHCLNNINMYLIVGFGSKNESVNDLVDFIVDFYGSMPDGDKKLVLNFSQFMPSPLSLAQRLPMDDILSTKKFINDVVKKVEEKISLNNFLSDIQVVTLPTSRLLYESFLLRGDRRIGQVMVDLYQRGVNPSNAKMKDVETSFSKYGLDYLYYLKDLDIDSILPWVVIDSVNKGQERTFLESWNGLEGNNE